MTDQRFSLKKYSSPDDLLEIPEIEFPVYPQKLYPSYPPYPSSPENGAENADQIDAREIWRRVRKHKWLILSIVVIFTTLASVQVFRTKAWYTASTVIEIGKENAMVIK